MKKDRSKVCWQFRKAVVCTVLMVAFLMASTAQAATTLRVQMILFWDAYQYVKNTVIPAFEEKYDVDVEFERVTWGNRMDKLIVGTAAGSPPDVFMNGAETVVDLVNNGFLAPIDKYLAEWPDLADFAPTTMQNSSLNGRQYGVPLYTDPRSFWYRADFFEEAGLNPDAPPSNWDELIQTARRLTRTDGNRILRQGFDLTRWTGNASSSMQDFVVYLWQNGGELTDPVTFEPTFNSSQGLETMRFMYDLQAAVRAPGNVVEKGTGSGSPIIRGTAAINLNTGAVVSETYRFEPELAEHMRAIVPPPGQSKRVTVTFSNWLAIHADSQQKDLAWEFIKTVTEAETLAEIDGLLGFISPRRSTVSMFVSKQPLVRYLYENLEHARPYPVFPNTGVLGSAFSSQYKQIIAGELGIEAGLDEAARLWSLGLKEGQ